MTASIAQATTLATTKRRLRPAPLEARAVATAIDALVTAALLLPFLALSGLTVLLQTDFLKHDPTSGEWTAGHLVAALWLPAIVAYHTLGAIRGASLGQRLLHLEVHDESGHPPSPAPALARALLHLLGNALLGLGALLPLINHDRRSLADRATHTRVWEHSS